MEMRPLHAHYPPAQSHLGGGERLRLAERAECPEMPMPISLSSLTSKHSTEPFMSPTSIAFGHQEPNSDLARQMTGLVPNAKDDTQDPHQSGLPVMAGYANSIQSPVHTGTEARLGSQRGQ